MTRQEQDLLADVFDAMPFLVIYKDTSNHILRVNQVVADTFGVTPEAMHGTHSSRWYPMEAEAYYQDDLEVIQSNQPKLGILELIDVGSEKRWFHTDKFPTHDSAGQVNGVVLIARDVTERKVFEQQLQHAQRMESIGRLAGGIAHDFNNLLTAICGFTELASNNLQRGESVGDLLELVQESCKRASKLTQQLLAFARKQVSRPQPTDLNRLIQSLLSLLQHSLRENVIIHTNLEAENNSLVDPAQIEQVIINLAINASDAMQQGGELFISTTDVHLSEEDLKPNLELTPGTYVKLVVRDTGTGMPPEIADQVFEPFFTTKNKGSGLGLAMCFGIVKQHQGHITLRSEIGQGTIFELYFAATPQSTQSATLPDSEKEVRGGGERILLVEDESLVRVIAETALRNMGYSVFIACDGQEALNLSDGSLGPQTYDLLVTDVVMPMISGIELASKLLELGVVKKVLLMSGYSDINLDSASRRRWAFLNKPFTPEELCTAVRNVLDEA